MDGEVGMSLGVTNFHTYDVPFSHYVKYSDWWRYHRWKASELYNGDHSTNDLLWFVGNTSLAMEPEAGQRQPRGEFVQKLF